MAEMERDIMRTVLAVLFILAFIGSSIWILRPFLGAIVWATTIVVATWPLMITVQRWLWCKRALAVIVMTLLPLCILVVPLTLAIVAVVGNVQHPSGSAHALLQAGGLNASERKTRNEGERPFRRDRNLP